MLPLQEVFSMRADLYNAPRQNPLDPDMDIGIRVNGLQIVYLARLVTILTNYATGIVPADAVVATGRASPAPSMVSMASLASRASAAVVSSIPAPKLGTKIKLVVVIKAPLITVPISSDSARLLVLDLGTLSVRNEFQTEALGQLEVGEDTLLITDHMQVDLEDLELYLVDVLAADVGDRRLLIEPIMVQTGIKRCLNENYRGLPALDVTCSISPVVVNLSDVDYVDLMAITTGNLAEASQVPQFASVAREEHGLEGPEQDRLSPAGVTLIDVSELEAQALLEPPEIFTLTVTEDPDGPATFGDPADGGVGSGGRPRSISRAVRQAMVQAKETTVYWLTTRARIVFVSLDVHLTVGQDAPLASLIMKGLGADVAMHSDDTKNVKAWLMALVVKDTRAPALSKFPMLLEAGAGDDHPPQRLLRAPAGAPVNLLEARIDQQGDEQSIVVLLSRPKLDLCMDFVMALLAFLPKKVDTGGETPAPSLDENGGDYSATTAITSVAVGAPPREGRMKLHFILDDLQVTMIEDHTNSNCRAIRIYSDARCVRLLGRECRNAASSDHVLCSLFQGILH